MKKIILLTTITIAFHFANAAKIVNGFYVTLNNDTINCSFKLPTDIWGDIQYHIIQSKVKCIDKNGEKIKFNPLQIKGFQFKYASEIHRYVSLNNDLMIVNNIFDNNERVFLRIRKEGRLKMYEYHIKVRSGGSFNGYTGTFTPGYSFDVERFCFQKGNEPLVRIKGINFAKKMSEYLADYPELSEKVRNKVLRKEDVNEIVDLYNSKN